MIPPERSVSRRSLIVGGAASIALAACGSGDDAGVATTDSELVRDPALQQLSVPFPDGFTGPSIFVTGKTVRAPYALVASDGYDVTVGEPETVSMTVSLDGVEVVSVDVPGRRAGIGFPYYALEFVPDSPGTYEVKSDWSDTPRQLLVNERSAVDVPLVGEALPPFDTPTFDNARGVDPICTRLPEPCPFHNQTLTESLASGKTTALILATPQFCQTTICGPVVELLVEAAPEYENLSVVHAEVWPNPFVEPPAPGGTLAGIMTAYNLTFEPSLYLANEDGVIVEALHFAYDRDELRAALDTHV